MCGEQRPAPGILGMPAYGPEDDQHDPEIMSQIIGTVIYSPDAPLEFVDTSSVDAVGPVFVFLLNEVRSETESFRDTLPR
jgi:hypothetical protein